MNFRAKTSHRRDAEGAENAQTSFSDGVSKTGVKLVMADLYPFRGRRTAERPQAAPVELVAVLPFAPAGFARLVGLAEPQAGDSFVAVAFVAADGRETDFVSRGPQADSAVAESALDVVGAAPLADARYEELSAMWAGWG